MKPHPSLDDTGYILYHQDMTGKEIMKHLKQHGWILDRIKGSHHIFIKGNKTIPVPVHGSKDICSEAAWMLLVSIRCDVLV